VSREEGERIVAKIKEAKIVGVKVSGLLEHPLTKAKEKEPDVGASVEIN